MEIIQMELFKYMPYRPKHNLFENWMFSFTPAPLFNDPFEGQMTKSSIVESSFGKLHKNVGGEWIKMTEKEIEDLPPSANAWGIGILSLSRSKHNLLMWAHYAKDHEGIIIGFDSTHVFFNQTIPPMEKGLDKKSGINTSLLGKIFPVNYERIRLEMNAQDDFDIIKPLLQKSDEWIYEKEYRMFLRTNDCDTAKKDNNKPLFLFKIPEKAITRIIMGIRSDKEKIIEDFKKALDNNPELSHIEIESAAPDKNLYHILHEPVNL